MGCRLVLELLALLRSAVLAGVPLRVRHVALMAAAVPTYHVEERGSLEQALTTPDRTKIYWSLEDRVLRFAFPIGQVLERPFPLGWRPAGRTALGRGGGDGRAGLASVQVSLDHSEYWSNKAVAEDVRTDLDGSTPIMRGRNLGLRASGTRSPGRRVMSG